MVKINTQRYMVKLSLPFLSEFPNEQPRWKHIYIINSVQKIKMSQVS